MKSSDREKLLGIEVKVINIGAQTFCDSIRDQGVEVIQVDWHPPAGGDMDLVNLLDRLG